MAVELGDKVKDSVTGYEGIAVAKTTWLHGCIRWLVQPPQRKDGSVPDAQAFDDPQLTVVKKHAVAGAEPPQREKRTYGPRNDTAATRR